MLIIPSNDVILSYLQKIYNTNLILAKKNFPFFCKNVKLWPAIESTHEVFRQSLKIKKYLQNLIFNMRKRFCIIYLTLWRQLRSKDTLLREFPEIRNF